MSPSRPSGTSHAHQSELIDEFDLLLGRSIRLFQRLEQGVEGRLLQLTSASSKPTGDLAEFLRLAVAEVSFSSKLRLLATLLSHQLPARQEYKECQANPKLKTSLEQETARAIASLKQLGKIEEQRNRYVHSHWLVLGQPPESTDIIPVIRTKTRANPKKHSLEFEEFSSEAFVQFLNMMAEAEVELVQSTGRLLGFLNYDEDKKDRSAGNKRA